MKIQKIEFQKLFLEDCRFLSVIPDDLKVEHHLTLNNTAISYIPETGAQIVEAQNCPYLKRIHPNISCTELNLFESAIEELPDHLSLKKLTLSFSKITRLPHHLSVNTLTLFSTDIKALPTDLIADDIDLSQTPIDFIPENINIKKIKKLDGRPFCIHFTPHLKEVFMVIPSDELEIHPDFNLNVFAGLSLEIIENAKKRYQKQHLIKKPSLIQKNELYLSIKDGERTHE